MVALSPRSCVPGEVLEPSPHLDSAHVVVTPLRGVQHTRRSNHWQPFNPLEEKGQVLVRRTGSVGFREGRGRSFRD